MAQRFSRLGQPIAPQPEPTRKPRKKTTFVEFILFGLLAILLIAGGFALYQQFSPKQDFIPATVDAGFKRDRINLLLIGIAGDRNINGGNDLADAIMVVSLKPSTKKAALISIPRDLYIDIGHFGVHRINAAHDIGYKMGYHGGGPGLLMESVSKVIGQPIDGWARIDFKAFSKIIDDLGGIDVFVYRPFRDYLFNDTFQQGWQHMNGERALRYARYRYVHGAEGNNFARELRQQQVIAAAKKKMQHLTVTQALSLIGSARTVSKYTATNLSTSDVMSLYRNFHDVPPANIRHVSLAPLTETFMVTKVGDTGEAVRPPGNNYAQIQAMSRDVFSDMRPLVNRDQIQLSEAGTPKPSDYAGDDSLRAKPR
jgi:LCP family protein required for cell wall assembly